ncbi:hypothetical protein CLAIMM_10967, partial [Cladophialophora immunda]
SEGVYAGNVQVLRSFLFLLVTRQNYHSHPTALSFDLEPSSEVPMMPKIQPSPTAVRVASKVLPHGLETPSIVVSRVERQRRRGILRYVSRRGAPTMAANQADEPCRHGN